jgi:hypothetical protein
MKLGLAILLLSSCVTITQPVAIEHETPHALRAVFLSGEDSSPAYLTRQYFAFLEAHDAQCMDAFKRNEVTPPDCDFNPLWCGQDLVEGANTLTIDDVLGSDMRATVAMPSPHRVVRVSLKYEDEEWKIDSVRCPTE